MTDRTNKGSLPIVVGVDGSSASKAALDWAARQATLTGAPLHAMITWEVPTNYGWAVPWPDGLDFAADARSLLDRSVSEILGDQGTIEVSKTVVEGHAAVALVDLSKEAALIVVGCRGHGSFTGMLLGSVSSHVVAHAHCPVVVVHLDAS